MTTQIHRTVDSPLYDQHWFADEDTHLRTVLDALPWDKSRSARVHDCATLLVQTVRGAKRKSGELDAFLQRFGLDTDEGLALMGLAEAILRIPDAGTINALIEDKISVIDWLAAQSADTQGDWMVKAAGWGLSLTQKTLGSVLGKVGQPVIRQAVIQAIRMMGRQFVLGESIHEAIRNSQAAADKGYAFSYDMLGEGARTKAQAEAYFQSYSHALSVITPGGSNGLSVKLSALHPRYSVAQQDRCVPDLTEKLLTLAQAAAARNLTLTMDAEETDRLGLSLQIFAAVRAHPSVHGWAGLGLAVQAYQKRALCVIDHVSGLASGLGEKIRLRLVKGAYWDFEIKRAQMLGLPDYPVWSRKENTDSHYLACAHRMLQQPAALDPLFGTHNAHTLAAILDMAGGRGQGVEFQRLHGMGEALFDALRAHVPEARVSLYAPVGEHRDLLAYLVRRLLENGANTSFVAKLRDPAAAISSIITDPIEQARAMMAAGQTLRHAHLPLPAAIYADQERVNSHGSELAHAQERGALNTIIASHAVVTNSASHEDMDFLFSRAADQAARWRQTPARLRTDLLNQLADRLEESRGPLIAQLVHEARKTWGDAIAELREAVDFCRYYAAEGARLFDEQGILMPGYTGEENRLSLTGRGVWVCISPWNFPLAIFIGQIAAALMAGNSVIAKPAEQTPGIARMVIDLLEQNPEAQGLVTLIAGDGALGARLVAHPSVAGVAFTGSTATARHINRALAAKDGPIVPLIAETGGINAMLIDSTALIEQAVDDVILSAFGSAGQRCSALRLVCVQDDIADDFLTILRGAMEELVLGDPRDFATDIGPVIDAQARDRILAHITAHADRVLARAPYAGADPLIVPPTVLQLGRINDLDTEIFGPVLHVYRYPADAINDVIDAINATGYGLTFGAQTRIASRRHYLATHVRAGNIYLNRSMIGAVVGTQPFGGMGLSGTGPKAGGPHYLARFATEILVSDNISAVGGNVTLLMQKG